MKNLVLYWLKLFWLQGMNLILREKIIEDFKKKYSREINEKGYLKNIEDNLLDGILEKFGTKKD